MSARLAPSQGGTPLAYLSGHYLPAAEAQLPVWDRGVVQGATVTEMVRTFRRAPFRLPEHLIRLRVSLRYLGISISESDENLSSIVQHLIESREATLPRMAIWGL